VRILAAHEAGVMSLALEGIEQTVARKRDHLALETPKKGAQTRPGGRETHNFPQRP